VVSAAAAVSRAQEVIVLPGCPLIQLHKQQGCVCAGQGTIYQSIFLDDKQSQKWTVGEIDKSKVLKTRMTRQFAHTWRHFAFWVPYVSCRAGRKLDHAAGIAQPVHDARWVSFKHKQEHPIPMLPEGDAASGRAPLVYS